MIAPQILVISLILSVLWGIYLAATIRDYGRSSPARKERVSSFRRVVVALCLWLTCFSYLFRTGMVLLGLGEIQAGQITFFALLGSNITGSIYAVVSLKFD